MTFALWLFAILLTPATLDQGRCSTCKRLGQTSTVTLGAGMACTTMYCGSGHYDEQGVFHPPPNCNTCTSNARCSRGHHITQVY